ncbi:hypothetical protein [Cellulomonas phragmiteti]|uniref:Uncharacterized protein n=1 Tax=Cellulomonas phragmiteti TaxID=478780 RepID=A0ABQ4DP12_9CELL|nr:hypothetical protein [Cellulomonas phragmiteti]GIG41089.1 hypothetical protein Cph01nite_28510 [Cellulomonas phragmiteti]
MTRPDTSLLARPVVVISLGVALLVGAVVLMVARPLWNDAGARRPVLVAASLGSAVAGAKLISLGRHHDSSEK